MEKLLEKLNQLYDILIKEEAKEFVDEIDSIRNNLVDIEKVKRLDYLCHHRVMGDINVETLSWQEWSHMLCEIRDEARIVVLRLRLKEYPDLHQTLSKKIELLYNVVLNMEDMSTIEKLDRIKEHLHSKKYIMQLNGVANWLLRKKNEQFSCEYGNWEDFLKELIDETEIWHQKLLDDEENC